jgi:hypothetical protein
MASHTSSLTVYTYSILTVRPIDFDPMEAVQRIQLTHF